MSTVLLCFLLPYYNFTQMFPDVEFGYHHVLKLPYISWGLSLFRTKFHQNRLSNLVVKAYLTDNDFTFKFVI